MNVLFVMVRVVIETLILTVLLIKKVLINTDVIFFAAAQLLPLKFLTSV